MENVLQGCIECRYKNLVDRLLEVTISKNVGDLVGWDDVAHDDSPIVWLIESSLRDPYFDDEMVDSGTDTPPRNV